MLQQQQKESNRLELSDFTNSEKEIVRQLREAKRRNGKRPTTIVVYSVDGVDVILEGVPRNR